MAAAVVGLETVRVRSGEAGRPSPGPTLGRWYG